MKKMYKAIALVLCAALLVAGSVFGTIAYLQMETKTVTNTFVTGKVEIFLKEYGINADGSSNTGIVYDETTATAALNNIKLVPGRTIYKHPFITVKSGSEECYLFVKVENTLSADIATINWDTSNWIQIDQTNIYYYKEAVTATTDTNVDIFTRIYCENDVQKYTAGGNIKITAYAVQAEGFDLATDAWTASGFGS